ncbi:hypothetical protein BJX62DRAFT_218917 [Aspergillus germanicus]
MYLSSRRMQEGLHHGLFATYPVIFSEYLSRSYYLCFSSGFSSDSPRSHWRKGQGFNPARRNMLVTTGIWTKPSLVMLMMKMRSKSEPKQDQKARSCPTPRLPTLRPLLGIRTLLLTLKIPGTVTPLQGTSHCTSLNHSGYFSELFLQGLDSPVATNRF